MQNPPSTRFFGSKGGEKSLSQPGVEAKPGFGDGADERLRHLRMRGPHLIGGKRRLIGEIGDQRQLCIGAGQRLGVDLHVQETVGNADHGGKAGTDLRKLCFACVRVLGGTQ